MFANSKHALALTQSSFQLELGLAVISKIEDGPVAQDARKAIIKLCKLTIYNLTSETLSLPSQFTTTLAILLLPA
jgi:hypothetical protein